MLSRDDDLDESLRPKIQTGSGKQKVEFKKDNTDNVAQVMADLALPGNKGLTEEQQLTALNEAYQRKKEVGKKALSAEGYTLLIEAVRGGKYQLLTKFRRDNGISWLDFDINFQDAADRRSALMYAVLAEPTARDTVVIFVTKRKADIGLKDKEKKTALQLALERGKYEDGLIFSLAPPNSAYGTTRLQFCEADFLALEQCKDQDKKLATLHYMSQWIDHNGPSAFEKTSLLAIDSNPKLAIEYVSYFPSGLFSTFNHLLDAPKYRRWLVQFWEKACAVAEPDYELLKAILSLEEKENIEDKKLLKMAPELAAKLARQALEKVDYEMLSKVKAKAPEAFSKTFSEDLDIINRFRDQEHNHLNFQVTINLLPVTEAIRYAAEQKPPQVGKLLAFTSGPAAPYGEVLSEAISAYALYAVDRVEQADKSEKCLPQLKKAIPDRFKEQKKDNDQIIEVEQLTFQSIVATLTNQKLSAKDKGGMLLNIVATNRRYCLLMVDTLLASGEVDFQAKDSSNHTALIHAVQHGLTPVVERLIAARNNDIPQKEAELALETAIKARQYHLIPHFASRCSKTVLKTWVHPDKLYPSDSPQLFAPHLGLEVLYKEYLKATVSYRNEKGDEPYLFDLVVAAWKRKDSALVRFYLNRTTLDGYNVEYSNLLMRLLQSVDAIGVPNSEVYKSWVHLLSTWRFRRIEFSCRADLFVFARNQQDVKMLFLLAQTTNNPGKFIADQFSHPGILPEIIKFLKIPANRTWIPIDGYYELPSLSLVEEAAKSNAKDFLDLLHILIDDIVTKHRSTYEGARWWRKVQQHIKTNIAAHEGKPDYAVCVKYLTKCANHKYDGRGTFDSSTKKQRVKFHDVLHILERHVDATEELGIRKAQKLMAALKKPNVNHKVYLELRKMIENGLAKAPDTTKWNELAMHAAKWHETALAAARSTVQELEQAPPIQPVVTVSFAPALSLFAPPPAATAAAEEKKEEFKAGPAVEDLVLAQPAPTANDEEPNMFPDFSSERPTNSNYSLT